MGVVQGSIPCKSILFALVVVVVSLWLRCCGRRDRGRISHFCRMWSSRHSRRRQQMSVSTRLFNSNSTRKELESDHHKTTANTRRRDEQGVAEVDNVATPHSTCLLASAHHTSHWCIHHCHPVRGLVPRSSHSSILLSHLRPDGHPYLPQRRYSDASWTATIGTQPSRAWTPVDDGWMENVSSRSHVCAFAQWV